MSNDETAPSRAIGMARLGIGLAQGSALYLLSHALDAKTWPATDGLIFAPLLMVFLYIPPLAIQGLGNLRARTFTIWVAFATALLAALAIYDVWVAWPVDWDYTAHWQPHVTPSGPFFFLAAAGLFVAHSLILGGDADRRAMAKYTTHFDVAWKLALQLALSAVFVGIFWLMLEMGAALFELIKLSFFRDLIQHNWFAIPATALATAAAIHVTDVRAGLVRGTRTLVLVLLSWLLPLLVLIVTGFLASLFFTGLASLWKIGHASALLLGAAAALIVLINATHQDGETEPPAILRLAGSLAALLLVPLVALAGYALSLRVGQYGWTDARIMTAAVAIVAAFHAAGYALAAVPRGAWLKGVESWNFYGALLTLAGVLALLTPLANPSRVSVADQMARLHDGRTKASAFDFSYLRWSGGRYGRDALNQLAASRNAFVSGAAKGALASTNRYGQVPLAPDTLREHVTVYPKGRVLPESFFKQATTNIGDMGSLSQMCIADAGGSCSAVLADIDGDGREEILMMTDGRFSFFGPLVFRDDGKGHWTQAGRIAAPYSCNVVTDALRTGRYSLAAPAFRMRDVVVDGRHFPFEAEQSSQACK
jgi:hypothetical protein